MALMTWSTDYSVEVALLDKQHQKLFEMLNKLHNAMRLGEGRHLAPRILSELVQYTREHFATEEALMKQANYPELIAHKAEHDKLTREVVKMVQDIEQGKAVLSMKLMQFLESWLKDHILGRDKKYVSYMK